MQKAEIGEIVNDIFATCLDILYLTRSMILASAVLEEANLGLNIKGILLEDKYKDKPRSHYEAPIATVVADIFRGLSGERITRPSRDFIRPHEQLAVNCSIKANEGHFFCLDKAVMLVPKPATDISMDNIASVTMSHVGGAMATNQNRTFDSIFSMKNSLAEQKFSNINRCLNALGPGDCVYLILCTEGQQPLENFFRAKSSLVWSYSGSCVSRQISRVQR